MISTCRQKRSGFHRLAGLAPSIWGVLLESINVCKNEENRSHPHVLKVGPSVEWWEGAPVYDIWNLHGTDPILIEWSASTVQGGKWQKEHYQVAMKHSYHLFIVKLLNWYLVSITLFLKSIFHFHYGWLGDIISFMNNTSC